MPESEDVVKTFLCALLGHSLQDDVEQVVAEVLREKFLNELVREEPSDVGLVGLVSHEVVEVCKLLQAYTLLVGECLEDCWSTFFQVELGQGCQGSIFNSEVLLLSTISDLNF